jgi:hypothetical protein
MKELYRSLLDPQLATAGSCGAAQVQCGKVLETEIEILVSIHPPKP